MQTFLNPHFLRKIVKRSRVISLTMKEKKKYRVPFLGVLILFFPPPLYWKFVERSEHEKKTCILKKKYSPMKNMIEIIITCSLYIPPLKKNKKDFGCLFFCKKKKRWRFSKMQKKKNDQTWWTIEMQANERKRYTILERTPTLSYLCYTSNFRITPK